MGELTAVVLDIQRFSLDDGPGIRTTVFLKGCNMQCKWCHNPESIKFKRELSFNESICVNCQKCLAVCKSNVHKFENNQHKLDFNKCQLCEECIDVCQVGALKIYGQELDVTTVVNKVLKDQNYYAESQGGVTFSGGEATLHFAFILECMKRLKQENIHIALETNGLIDLKKLVTLNEYVDLFLIDFKHYDSQMHHKYTNKGNEKILDTLLMLSHIGGKVRLRCPIIPGINDQKEHFQAIANLYINEPAIIEYEVLGYHNIGLSKWASLGLDNKLKAVQTVSNEQVENWTNTINNYIKAIKADK